MVEAQDVRELFNDARSLHESALSLMEKGDLRDAAEKVWGAREQSDYGIGIGSNR